MELIHKKFKHYKGFWGLATKKETQSGIFVYKVQVPLPGGKEEVFKFESKERKYFRRVTPQKGQKPRDAAMNENSELSRKLGLRDRKQVAKVRKAKINGTPSTRGKSAARAPGKSASAKLVREKKAKSQSAQSSRTHATTGGFKRNDRVRIKGLKNSPTYNGKVGAILEVKDGKVKIKLDKSDGFPNEIVSVLTNKISLEKPPDVSKAQSSKKIAAGSGARPAQSSSKKPLPSQAPGACSTKPSTTRTRKIGTSRATSSPTKDLTSRAPSKPNPRARPATNSETPKASESLRPPSNSPAPRDHNQEKQRPESKKVDPLRSGSPEAGPKVIRPPTAATPATVPREEPTAIADLAPTSQPAATAATQKADAVDHPDPAASTAAAELASAADGAEREDTEGTSAAEHKSVEEPEAQAVDADAEASSQASLTDVSFFKDPIKWVKAHLWYSALGGAAAAGAIGLGWWCLSSEPEEEKSEPETSTAEYVGYGAAAFSAVVAAIYGFRRWFARSDDSSDSVSSDGFNSRVYRDPHEKEDSSPTALIVFAVLAGLALLVTLLCCLCSEKRHRRGSWDVEELNQIVVD